MPRRPAAPDAPQGARLVETLLGGWRPLARIDAEGFALLRSRGITRRANSAVALDAPRDPAALGSAIDRIEQLCALSAQAPVFRVFEDMEPLGLDALLAARGYGTGPSCDLLALPLLGSDLPRADPTARIDIGPLPEDWFASGWRLFSREGARARDTVRDILAGTPAIHAALPAVDDGEAAKGAVAVGRAALVDQGRRRCAIVNCVATDPRHRRRGLGRAVMHTLLAAAAEAGAEQALLEVETDNPAALRLYRRLGFTRFGGYHYRLR
ncbi:GNAT family N-acetyltransferase [Brachybacterium hainanense]|uniref:GNAT family N-acetyltransferase n=1 Tax=Brachybacterium hainanense TaxID=1541174 RepID=A0ABV6R8R2_9MICO